MQSEFPLSYGTCFLDVLIPYQLQKRQALFLERWKKVAHHVQSTLDAYSLPFAFSPAGPEKKLLSLFHTQALTQSLPIHLSSGEINTLILFTRQLKKDPLCRIDQYALNFSDSILISIFNKTLLFALLPSDPEEDKKILYNFFQTLLLERGEKLQNPSLLRQALLTKRIFESHFQEDLSHIFDTCTVAFFPCQDSPVPITLNQYSLSPFLREYFFKKKPEPIPQKFAVYLRAYLLSLSPDFFRLPPSEDLFNALIGAMFLRDELQERRISSAFLAKTTEGLLPALLPFTLLKCRELFHPDLIAIVPNLLNLLLTSCPPEDTETFFHNLIPKLSDKQKQLLTRLDLKNCALSDELLTYLATAFPHIEHLCLSQSTPSCPCPFWLTIPSSWENSLATLDLRGRQPLKHLFNCETLKHLKLLDVSYTSLTEAPQVAPSLETFLGRGNLHLQKIFSLHYLPHLHTVDITATSVEVAPIGCPSLQTFHAEYLQRRTIDDEFRRDLKDKESFLTKGYPPTLLSLLEEKHPKDIRISLTKMCPVSFSTQTPPLGFLERYYDTLPKSYT